MRETFIFRAYPTFAGGSIGMIAAAVIGGTVDPHATNAVVLAVVFAGVAVGALVGWTVGRLAS